MVAKREALNDSEPFIKMMMFGPTKAGKTTAIATAAKFGRVIALDTEGQGWLARPLKAQGVNVDNIDVYRPTTIEDMKEIYWEIRGDCEAAAESGSDDRPYLVAVDHMSDLQKRFITRVREERVAKGRGGKDGPYETDRGDYGVWTNQADEILRLYRDLPCHVVFAAHTRTERVKYPDISEVARNNIMGSTNMNCALTTMELPDYDRPLRVGYFDKIDGWDAGDRMGITRPMVANPTLERLILALRGELDWATDPEQAKFKEALRKANS